MSQWLRSTTRARIYARDTPPGQRSPACVYCGRAVQIGRLPGDSESGLLAAVVDHIFPGAGNDVRNLVTACWSCNAEKGERTPDEWEAARVERGLDPRPPWRSRRPEPDLGLLERCAEAVLRPICGRRSAACSARVAEVEARRKAAAAFQRAARRRR